jgi:hypothetical protein
MEAPSIVGDWLSGGSTVIGIVSVAFDRSDRRGRRRR